MSVSLYGQISIDDHYQYIVVADKFDVFKEVDKYKTSSLTKFLLKKKGFKVYLNNEKLPNELNKNRCLGLFASVKDDSSLFTIKSIIEIKDCFGKIIYTSKVGLSKLKEYQKGYHQAIRKAFESMEDFEYPFKKETIAQNISDNVVANVLETPKLIILQDVNNNLKDITPEASLEILYAQSIENGFQLVTKSPKIVFKILKTSKKDNFIIKDKNGVFYKKGAIWVSEYYEGNKWIKKEYQVKF